MGPFRYIYLHENLKKFSKYIVGIIYKYLYIYIPYMDLYGVFATLLKVDSLGSVAPGWIR